MGNKITICHWNESGHWNSIEISTNALNGHENHEMDIWAPVEGVTPGMNWPKGEAVYLNGCVLEASPSPSPEPSPSSSLPDTGATAYTLLLALVLLATGLFLLIIGRRHGRVP